MLRRAIILLGLASICFSGSGAASLLHRVIDHAPEAHAHACDTPGHAQPTSDRAPSPDHDSGEECDLCATLAASREAVLDGTPSAPVDPFGWSFVGLALETRWSPGVSLTTGPPRGPPARV